MEKITLTKQASERVSKGYPLLTSDDFLKKPELLEGTIVECVDPRKNFLATAYLAKQNKGDGWILSTNPKEKINSSFFKKLFLQAKENRSSFRADDTTSAYRFFNGEGDGLGGLTIDCYADYYVFSWYSEGIYKHQKMLVGAFKEAVPNAKGIYQKLRFKTDTQPETDHIDGEQAPEPLLIKENGITYATYLNEGLMTGIFLDQRNVRYSLFEKYAAGKTVLNTFSYTGAFSVAAALGGASHTTSVDLANRSLEKTQEQFEVNGINPENHTIRVMDVFDYFRYAVRKDLAFDIVVVDPPSFARSKKRTFSASKDYSSLLEEVIAITNPGGIIVASTNAANVSLKKFEKMVQDAFSKTGTAYSIIEKHQLPEDFKVNPHFRQGNYLKVFIIQKG